MKVFCFSHSLDLVELLFS
jgi:hypothetical protein